MPPACLAFYLDAYLDYLLGERCAGDADAASCFFGLVEIRGSDMVRMGPATVARVQAVLARIASNQAWFEADSAIYGDFEALARKSLRRL